MMKRKTHALTPNVFLLGLLAVILFSLFGCATPKYQFCCGYEQAFPENPDDAVCWGYDEEGVEQTIGVLGCSEETYSCTIIQDGEETEIPVCAYMDTVACETECAGVFCGQFFYDPRPMPGIIPDNQSHDGDVSDKENAKVEFGDPLGMWNAQCKVEQMTPLFIRQVENSDTIVLNTFRFGIGDSFQDFEEAQYYFPLTDQACFLNELGTVDRYILYAIPNSVEGNGPMCAYNGNTHIYTCSEDGTIQSYSYFDCASRCALQYYGYDPEIDPFNPYPSIRKGSSRVGGNPFAYWVGTLYETYDSDPRKVPVSSNDEGEIGINALTPISDDTRSTVKRGELDSGLYDRYPTGTVLYGATFGYDMLSTNDGEQFFTELKEDEGEGKLVPELKRSILTEDWSNYYSLFGQDAANYLYFDWYYEGGTNDNRARTVFFTQEEDSHAIYPWLLAHHSVYNKQFETGHYLADGSHEEGAEFECLSSSECLSGYCNDFDYSRGTCVDEDGNDILCDCSNQAGTVVCLGAAAVDVPSWDREGTDVEVPYVLPAPVDDEGGGQNLVSLPSIGRVHMTTFTENADPENGEPIELGDMENPVPMFVMFVGGMGFEYEDFGGFSRVSPDYGVMGWGDVPLYEGEASYEDTPGSHDGDVSQIDLIMNPCGMMPDWGWWSITWSDEKYFECCNDGDCCTLANGYDSTNPKHHCVKYPFAADSKFDYAPEAGTYSTRFMENCMEGYEDYVHLCYAKDGDDEVHFWGWDLGSTTELESTVVDGSRYDSFCEHLARMEEESDRSAQGYVNCYLWESGGYFPISNSDECVLEAEAFIAIEPRWIEGEEEGEGRWAFGRCMLNSQGDDLETHDYGMCESCGFLTMAKEQISGLTGEYIDPDDGSVWDGLFDYHNDMYGNTYCPDMVISTPYAKDSFLSVWAPTDEGEYATLFFYGLEEFGMNGYNQYLFGSSVWGSSSNHDLDECIYPNGYELYSDHNNEWEAPNRQRGLPYTYPNAYYINTELETMMKRNIQPVLFASDWDLWDTTSGDENLDIEDDFSVVLKLNGDGEIDWATNELIADLYLNRNYLFIGNSDTEDDDVVYSTGSFLANTVINEGAVILVTYLGERENINVDCSDGDCEIFPRYNHDEIVYRGRATRLLCPNCMIAVGAGYDGGYQDGRDYNTGSTFGSGIHPYNPLSSTLDDGFNLGNRRAEIRELFSDDEVLDFVDVVAINVQLSQSDNYCDMDFDTEEEKFEYIIGELQELGSWSLSTYGKPLIITDLRIDYWVYGGSSACWDDEVAGRFMAYMGENANKLAKAGYLGVIYGSWDAYGLGGVRDINEANVDYYRGDFYEGVFAAARNFAGHSFTIYYSEAQVGPACPCVPCGPADKPGICNGHYLGDTSAPICMGYQEGMKWADGCISEDICTYPEEGIGTEVSCQIIYNNGTRVSATYQMDDVIANPSAYRDVIGSLESSESGKYCFVLDEEEGTSVTYTMTDQYNFDSTPAVFSLEGDLIVECDPTETLLEPFCGYLPPVTDYRMECEIK